MADPYSFAPVVLGSNQALATSLTDISGLSFNVVAGAAYRFEAFLNYVTVGTTVTVGFSMGGTLTEGLCCWNQDIHFSAAGGTTSQTFATIPGAATPTGAITVAGTYALIISRGFVRVTTGGTLTIQGIRGGATSATIQSGSTFFLEEAA